MDSDIVSFPSRLPKLSVYRLLIRTGKALGGDRRYSIADAERGTGPGSASHRAAIVANRSRKRRPTQPIPMRCAPAPGRPLSGKEAEVAIRKPSIPVHAREAAAYLHLPSGLAYAQEAFEGNIWISRS